MRIRILLLISLLCFVGVLFAKDGRVENALNNLGLNYELDDDGDYQLLFSYSDNRTQLVWVSGGTENFFGMEIREIFSYAYETDGNMPVSVARQLLKANAGYKIGAWELRGDGPQYGIFVARINADATPDEMKKVIDAVAVTADEMEKEILGTDEW